MDTLGRWGVEEERHCSAYHRPTGILCLLYRVRETPCGRPALLVTKGYVRAEEGLDPNYVIGCGEEMGLN